MSNRRTSVAVLALTFIALAAWALPSAVAHENANHGTIKVHDEESVDPPQQNQPHVCSPFYIQGFIMTDESGTLVFDRIPPGGSEEEVLVVNWTADSGNEEDGYEFIEGPLTLADGHYRVSAYVDDPEPHSREHSSKSKVFWVDCGGEECPGPRNVQASANPDEENITVTWSPVGDAEGYNVYRSEGAGSFELVASVGGDTTEYLDEDVTNGVTYRYRVTAIVNEGEETAFCDTGEATAIPDLPGTFALVLAGSGGLAAYAVLRRRKA